MPTISTLSQLNINSNSRILVFMPHPDDEAVFCSGLLKKLTTNNLPVKLITLTSGEKSTLVFGLKPGDDLATTRRIEQKNSCEILGITDFEVLTFPDGGLKTKEEEVKEIIFQQINLFEPTHVVTLEPDGIYGHPDHIALSKFVCDIVKDPIKLLYATIPEFKKKRPVSKMSEKDEINPIPPEYVLKLTSAESAAKIASLRAHRTQFGDFLSKAKSFIFFKSTKLLDH
ncbi:MAG TPA: PIG-L family deacetylase, partial [Candidatus Methanoperedens sp.]|nr:PIG-L family deacetylase [Candidatus Methanoperedens sp.]